MQSKNTDTRNVLKKIRNAAIIFSAITALLFVIIYAEITVPFMKSDMTQTCTGLALTITLILWMCAWQESAQKNVHACNRENCGCRHH